MRHTSIMTARAALSFVVGFVALASAASAQAPAPAGTPPAAARRIGEETWRVTASTGAYAPRSALIIGADGKDTRLSAGPSVSLDLQYVFSEHLAGYGNGTLGFSGITLGTAIRPTTTGPSDQVMVMGGTAGLILSSTLGTKFQPTLRLGGGFKGYSFDLTDAENQWRPTGDIGIGFRGVGSGPIEMSAEVRYLPSSFDQGKLPIRGIVPQAQRQTDLVFSVGVSIRP